ncbi:hypothetical protein [Portibacter marinus]|uniref:hypothetical protein n=1 Tax=Portibacter marinus TaxID=2898660 RepID=UPI001F3B4D7F|nr:hypothetical protein [Portibacter marinus]
MIFLLNRINIENVFLIDAIGALITALMVGVVLPYFQFYIGMPIHVLRLLAVAGLMFAVYSFTCHFSKLKYPSSYLKIIALLNLSYCLVTLIMIVIHKASLTYIGYTYFIIEIIIVLILINIEWKMSTSLNRSEIK